MLFVLPVVIFCLFGQAKWVTVLLNKHINMVCCNNMHKYRYSIKNTNICRFWGLFFDVELYENEMRVDYFFFDRFVALILNLIMLYVDVFVCT